MPRRVVTLLNVYDWVRRELQELLTGDDIEVTVVPDCKADVWTLPQVVLFLVGHTRGEPSETVALVRRVREAQPCTPVLLLAWASSEQLAIAALKEGVADYFAPPIELEGVAAAVRRTGACPPNRVDRDFRGKECTAGRAIVGESRSMRDLRDYLRNVALRAGSTVMELQRV